MVSLSSCHVFHQCKKVHDAPGTEVLMTLISRVYHMLQPLTISTKNRQLACLCPHFN